MRLIQIKLLLWKNAILIKRKPWVTLLQIILPLVLFLILLFVRLKLPPVNVSDKFYYAKPMPSAGYVPFIQSLLCDPISGRPEMRLEHVSPYKSYSGASVYPMISLVDATVQLTDTYSLLTEYHTTILREMFNISDTDDIQAVKDSISRVWENAVENSSNLLPSSSVLDTINSGDKSYKLNKRDLSSMLTAPYEELQPFEPAEEIYPDPTDEIPFFNALKDKASALLDPMSAQQSLRKLAKATLDNKTGKKLDRSVEMLLAEYMSHKYLEKGGRDHKDWLDHATKLQETLCRDSTLRTDKQVQLACQIMKRQGKAGLESLDMDLLSMEVMVASQRISERTKMVKFDLKALQLSNRTRYIQGMLCGRDPASISPTDEETRTLGVKLKLLSGFKKAKITYCPDTSPVRDIIAKMNTTFETAVTLRNFSTHWVESAPLIQKCLQSSQDSITLQEIIDRVTDCYKKDSRIVPEELRPWFDKFTRQQKVLRNILKVIQTFDDFGNYTQSILELHPVLQTPVSTATMNSDIQLITDHLKLYIQHTEDIDFNVFVPFNDTDLMEQWIKTSNELVWSGIVFSNVNNTLPPHIRYTLRMNGALKVGTGEIAERFWSPNPMNGFSHRRYEWSGFVFLQDIVDRSLISLQQERAGVTPSQVLPASYIQEIPYPCHCWDAFLKNSIMVLPLALCVSFMYSVCVIVRNVVHEKEMRIREAMQQMGLSNSVHWCSWFVTSMLQMSVTATMLVSILFFGNILRHSNPLLLWLFLHAGALATVSFCFLLSVFFSEAKLAAAGSGLAYIVMYLPYTCISQSDGGVGTWSKYVVSLFSTSAFGMGMEYTVRFEEQGVGLQWHTLTQGVFPTDEYNMMRCFAALLGDAIIYFLLALYIEGVFPGRYGVPKPWYFPLKFLFWCRHPSPSRNRHNSFELPGHTFDADIERPPENLTCGISMCNLTKKYKGMERRALDNLSLDLYENQILTLLGHNGAGKTTTMSIISGLYPPTTGTATIYGKDIRKDMKQIRQDLGVCPQFNVLFEHLTVAEHLWFFASLKQTPPDRVMEEVESFMKNVGLADKADCYARELSGGMKRKLCVAMAFVGGSRIVILDEPTAGVDPWSRRSIWEMVLKHKQDRTILLSTHHMDEADLLGDRVAIMSHGKLLCCGSPLYLKSRFGPGYYLNIEKDTGVEAEDAPENFEDSGFIATDFSETSTVVSPLASPASVKKINKYKHSELSRLIKTYVPRATIHHDNDLEVSFLLPWEAFQRGVFPDLFKELDEQASQLGIKCYGVMDSTLEEVFLSVADVEKPKTKNPSDLLYHNSGSSARLLADFQVDEDCEADEDYARNYGKGDDESLLPLCKQDIPPSSFFRQIRAQILKRVHHTRRDWLGLVFQLVLPAVFVSLAMIIASVRPHFDSSKQLELSVEMFKHPYYVPFSDNSTNGTSRLAELVGYPAGPWAPNIDAEIMALKNFTTPKHTSEMKFPWNHYYNSPIGTCGNHQYPEIPKLLEFTSITGYTLQNLTGWNLEKFLVQTNMDYVFQRYGALTFGESHNDLKKYAPKNWSESSLPEWGVYNPNTAKAWHSYRGTHALPTYLSAVNNLVLRAALPAAWKNLSEYGVTVTTHPLPNNGSLADVWELLDEESYDLVISMFIIIALSFVPASFVLFLVSERCSGLFLLECIAGARIVPYWVSNFIWDLVSFTAANSGCLLVIIIFHSPSFSSSDNIPATFVLFALYSWSITPVMYLFSKIFSEPNNAYVVMICINTFCGVTTTLCTFLIEFLAPNDIDMITVNNALKYLFLLFPNYCLGRGIMDLAANQFANDLRLMYGYPKISPWSWELIGRNLVFMAITGVLYTLLLCLISIPRQKRRRNVPNLNKDLEDEDVRTERRRTICSYGYNDVLKTQNLCKIYGKKHIAVNRLAFSVSPGECFGLLGINGAGKTTSFKMLTGQLSPSNGDAVVSQMSLSHQMSTARRQMGYCPQSDALLPTLTSYETLALFARLRGIPECHIDHISRKIIRTVGLTTWASRPCGTYSGGNKRKLSAAITLVGEPRLILLDEPTAGMDPGARRALWAVIQAQKRKGKAVVITSHSMSECEVLCSRIGIMVGGRLRCLGSAQHLRDKYGNGYVIQLKLNPQGYNLHKVKSHIELQLPGAVLTQENYCNLQYEVKQSKCQVADIFNVLQQAKPLLGLLDYAVHQTNLEQVFINFAQAEKAENVDDELLCLEENVVTPSNLQLSLE
ncbi:hypothetical protein ACHWQZ_G019415 [Mnemiopsis leidyi]